MDVKQKFLSFLSLFKKRHPNGITWLFVLGSFAASLLVMAVILPDLFLHARWTFLWQHDTEIPFENTFTLISHFYQGGVQLWNRYDQTGYAFSHLTSGLYTLANILTAGVYILLSPLMPFPGESFHHLYSVVFFSVNMLIRSIGGYLLARKFTKDPFVILCSIIYLNTFLSAIMYPGILTNNLYSYLPLLLYFILCFLEKFELNDFLCAFLTMTLVVANSPLFALGYFYQGVHFFLVSALIWRMWIRKSFARDRTRQSSRPDGAFRKGNFVKIGFCALLAFLVILPSLQMAQVLKEDFFVAGSGLGGETSGRLNNRFSVSGYFQDNGQTLVPPEEFLSDSLDFENNRWPYTWTFMGGSVFVLAFLALVFSRNTQKHIFFWTILFIIGANFPLNPKSPFSLAHWVNALTNPFHFLVRSFHMTDLLLPYFFLPLAAMGLQAGKDILLRRCETVYAQRLPLAMGLLLAVLAVFALTLPSAARVCGISAAVCSLAFLYLCAEGFPAASVFSKFFSRFRVWLGLGIFTAMLVVDLRALAVYLNNDPYTKRDVLPRRFTGLGESPLILDYQNPRLLPWREYARTDPSAIEPRVATRQNHHGLFYQYTPWDRYFIPPNIYTPVHRSYKDIAADYEIQAYLRQTPSLISPVPRAIFSSRAAFAEVLARGFVRDAAVIEEEDARLPFVVNSLRDAAKNRQEKISGERRLLRLSLTAQRSAGPLREYRFRLPKDFPGYVSTTVFTKDRELLRCQAAGRRLTPVQGKLTEPFTFDVQNVRSGEMALLLPADFPAPSEVLLEAALPSFLLDIWHNQQDRLGLTYAMPYDGWLVFHFPFDKKWRLSVDEKPVDLSRVNKYFMGVPLTKGEHRLFLEYWPRTLLREWIVVSIILTMGVFTGIAAWGLRREGIGNDIQEFL